MPMVWIGLGLDLRPLPHLTIVSIVISIQTVGCQSVEVTYVEMFSPR